MKALVKNSKLENAQNVLLIGNNPSDLGNIYERLKESRSIKYMADIYFDVKKALKNATENRPNYIVIDDNMNSKDVRSFLKSLRSNSKTMEIPVTIIKNTNTDNSPKEGVEEFILKEHLTSEAIVKSLSNSLRISRMQAYVRIAYRRRKKQLLNLK